MTNLNVLDVYNHILKKLTIGFRNEQIFIMKNSNWIPVSKKEFPIIVRHLFTPDEEKSISSYCIEEVVKRLTQSPALQLSFIEDNTDKYIKLKDGVFNAETGKIENSIIGNFGYHYNFNYLDVSDRNYPVFENFIDSIFPDNITEKKQLLLEIMGYVLSDYTLAKTGFFLIGESNSGKSTILRLIQRVFPKECVTNIPLENLTNSFKVASLSDARINICPELTKKSFAAADIFKAWTSNEETSTSYKHKDDFTFQLRCKSLNAGNCLPEIKTAEGAEALINRMTILLFTKSVAKNDQDLLLPEKLWQERDSIFSEALDALVQLRKREFRFCEPEDTKHLKKRLVQQGKALPNFFNDCCVFENGGREHLATLYTAFKDYCEENLYEMSYTKNFFSQYLCQLSGIQHSRFRINGSKSLWGIKGLRLKTSKEYERQDSDSYSDILKNKLIFRNTGTTERKEQEEQNNGK